MNAAKAWIVVAAVAITVGAGACGGGAKVTAHLTTSTTGTQLAAGPQSATPTPTSARPSTTVTTAKGQVAGPTTNTTLSPQDAVALIFGINDQIQKAETTPAGPQALTAAQAQAIVDAQNKALGISKK